MEKIDFDGVALRRWSCGSSTYVARPELGARLMNWNLRMADGSMRDVIHWPENADYSKFVEVQGGNPFLFPFSARTFHAGNIGQWKDASGVIRPMPLHGFARYGQFEIISIDENGFTAELQADEVAAAAYPFNYRFTVRYIFKEVSL